MLGQLERVRAEVHERYGAFLRERVNPGAAQRDLDDQPIPRELVRAAADLGLLRYALPRDVGGEAADALSLGVTLEELGYLCDDASFTPMVSFFVSVALALHDFPALRESHVRPMGRGERLGTLAYTDVGGDPFAFQTAAAPRDGGFVLDGEKTFQTGGELADSFLVYARDAANDLSLFLVERTDPGVEVLSQRLVGLRAAGISRLVLRDVRLPLDRCLVRTDALAHAQRFLNGRRLFSVCGALGRARALLEHCMTATDDVLRYGQPIAELQNVQATFGRMFVGIESARALAYHALDRLRVGRHDPLFDPVVSAAKYQVTEQIVEIATTAMRLLGGRSYHRGSAAERFLRDGLGAQNGAGSQDVLEINIGVTVLSEHRRRRAKAGQR